MIDKIDSIIIDYNKNNYAPGKVLMLSKKLSGYLYFFVKYLTDSKADHTKKYFIRKIEVERSKQNIVNQQLKVNEKVNISRAEMDSTLLNEDKWKLEVDAASVTLVTQ